MTRSKPFCLLYYKKVNENMRFNSGALTAIIILFIFYTHQNKFCITSVPQVPEPVHTNGIEIHTNNISALFIAHENNILHGVPSYR